MDKLRDSLKFSLLQQAVVLLFAAGIMDRGNILKISLGATLACWTVAGSVWIRRRDSPTRVDLVFIRWGFIPLCVLTNLIVHYVWSLKKLN